MKTTYAPRGVCSNLITVEVKNGIITRAEIQGGCSGNLSGIASLISGMPASDAIAKLKGIRCGGKATSCPDQLSRALEQCLCEEKE